MGYVYLIEADGVHKIGVTRKNDRKRLSKLQTGNSHELNVLYMFQTEYPFRLETILHNRFGMYRIRNEWFKLPTEVVESFDTICREVEEIIILMKDNHFFKKNLR